MWGIAGIVFFLLWAMLRPRERAYEPAPPPQSGSSGLGGALLLIVIIAFVGLMAAGTMEKMDAAANALGKLDAVVIDGAKVHERADNHVAEKHGLAAQNTVKDAPQRDYHYSKRQEMVMVSSCDSVNCAVMLVGVEGVDPIALGITGPQAIDGRVEVTTHYMAVSAREKKIATDGYIFIGKGP